MVSHNPLPQDMTELKDDKNELGIFLSWPIQMRCELIHRKTQHEGWPVERTCAMFQVSSTWYRDRAMRFGDEWENEYQSIQDENMKFNEFHERATKIMGFDFSTDANINRLHEIIFSIQEYSLQEDEGIFEYESIPDELLTEAGLIFEFDIVPDEFIHTAEGIIQNGTGTTIPPTKKTGQFRYPKYPASHTIHTLYRLHQYPKKGNKNYHQFNFNGIGHLAVRRCIAQNVKTNKKYVRERIW